MTERINLPQGRRIEYVQRIVAAENTQKNGVDKYFAFDYMGAAEFEFGALPLSLQRMRESGSVATQQHVKFRHKNLMLSFAFIGPSEFAPAVARLFEAQSHGLHCGLKEPTGVACAYGLELSHRYSDIIGWWDVENDWVAFKKARYAHLWIEGIRSKK